MKISVKVGNTYYEAYEVEDLKDKVDFELIKQAVIDQILKPKYQELIASTDARILQYQKRKELGILTEDDENDYQNALREYRQWTEWYRQKKQEIQNTRSIDDLLNISLEP